MKKDLTDITIVLDRSGSMYSCKEEAENGLEQFLSDQKALKGDCFCSLVQFDTEIDTVYDRIPVGETPKFTLVPRGMTALLDALGSSINKAGKRLSLMLESERPELIVFVIITDGHENASHEFSAAQIKEMIELQQDTYSWKFVFLGANQDAFTVGGSLGIDRNGIANYDTQYTDQAFNSASEVISRCREATMDCSETQFGFNDTERSSMSG